MQRSAEDAASGDAHPANSENLEAGHTLFPT